MDARSDSSFQLFTPHPIGPHRSVRTATRKLIHSYAEGDVWELFDLQADPNELKNLYGFAEMEALTASLKNELERLRRQYKGV